MLLAMVAAAAAVTACTDDPAAQIATPAVTTTPSPSSSTAARLEAATSPTPAASRAAATTPAAGDRHAGVDGSVMRYPERSEDRNEMDVLVRGVLQLEACCLYVRPDGSGQRYPILCTAGTRWDTEHQFVMLPTGEHVAVGETVSGGGGYLYVADVERVAGHDASTLAARCVDNTSGAIAVVNNHNTAIRAGAS